jgi:hypothetical protein
MTEHSKPDLNYKPVKILMTCSDGRFIPAFDATAQAHGHLSENDQPNQLRIPGPSVSLTEESTREVNINYIGALLEFFDCHTLALYDHIPCGWMKKAVTGYAEADNAGKARLHEREIKAAGIVLKHSFPELLYEPHLIGEDGKEIALTSEG